MEFFILENNYFMNKIKLKEISTFPPQHLNEEEIRQETKKFLSKLSELQAVLYAEAKHSVLIILQGMDASGKDGVVQKVFTGVNPMGCRVKAFKVPTEEEQAHDFLWRIHLHTPPKGMIQIFNRSHYEDILVPKVHKLLDKKILDRRLENINSFENLLADNQTIIFKFYLHISEEEQQQRLQERLFEADKKWKYQEQDLRESRYWKEYRQAYEEIFEASHIHWHIIPSDKKWYRNYLIAKEIVEKLESLDMKYPEWNDKKNRF
jgi:PPK2 family polyphosphate:nucleotide phosphotransferase